LNLQNNSQFHLREMLESLRFPANTIRKETLEKLIKEIEAIRNCKLDAEIEPNMIYWRDRNL
jgi:hypothetical protein